jgi:hypothetical protein
MAKGWTAAVRSYGSEIGIFEMTILGTTASGAKLPFAGMSVVDAVDGSSTGT